MSAAISGSPKPTTTSPRITPNGMNSSGSASTKLVPSSPKLNFWRGSFLTDRDEDRDRRQHADQHEAGDDAGEQEPAGVPDLPACALDADQAVDGAVDEQRQRRREQQADRAGAGDQAHREPLGVAVADQRGHQHAAERDDRDARGAGEHREQRARADRDDREAARHPAEQRVREPHEAVGGLRLGEQVAGVDEQRDGRHRLDLVAEADVLDHRDVAVELLPEVELDDAARRTERGRARA